MDWPVVNWRVREPQTLILHTKGTAHQNGSHCFAHTPTHSLSLSLTHARTGASFFSPCWLPLQCSLACASASTFSFFPWPSSLSSLALRLCLSLSPHTHAARLVKLPTLSLFLSASVSPSTSSVLQSSLLDRASLSNSNSLLLSTSIATKYPSRSHLFRLANRPVLLLSLSSNTLAPCSSSPDSVQPVQRLDRFYDDTRLILCSSTQSSLLLSPVWSPLFLN
jgi:hypothetical protein